MIHIDDEDLYILFKYKWKIINHKTVSYITTTTGKCRLYLHRILLKCPKGLQIDHINGNGLDNRKENLRICTHAENGRNRKVGDNNTSGYKGVSWITRQGKWRATIKINQKRIHLGEYVNIIDAINAYETAATNYFGSFKREGML